MYLRHVSSASVPKRTLVNQVSWLVRIKESAAVQNNYYGRRLCPLRPARTNLSYGFSVTCLFNVAPWPTAHQLPDISIQDGKLLVRLLLLLLMMMMTLEDWKVWDDGAWSLCQMEVGHSGLSLAMVCYRCTTIDSSTCCKVRTLSIRRPPWRVRPPPVISSVTSVHACDIQRLNRSFSAAAAAYRSAAMIGASFWSNTFCLLAVLAGALKIEVRKMEDHKAENVLSFSFHSIGPPKSVPHFPTTVLFWSSFFGSLFLRQLLWPICSNRDTSVNLLRRASLCLCRQAL